MHIKLTDYMLGGHMAPPNKIEYGLVVAPCNGVTSIGTIVDISDKMIASYRGIGGRIPDNVTVLWAGPGKKAGKKTLHPPYNLIDFKQYFDAVKSHYDSLESLLHELPYQI